MLLKFELLQSSSPPSFEHSTRAAKNGSSLWNLLLFLGEISSWWSCFLAAALVVPAGGGGRRWPEEPFFFEPCSLGIPGSCSQENGTPLNLRGVLGLKGGNSSLKEENDDDLKEESQELEEDEENEGVRLPIGRKIGAECGGSSSFGRSGVWPLICVGEVAIS